MGVGEKPSKKEMKQMAKNIETFLYMFERFIICDGLSKKKFKKAKKTIQKLVEKLKKGEWDDVVDKERVYQLGRLSEKEEMYGMYPREDSGAFSTGIKFSVDDEDDDDYIEDDDIDDED